MTEYKIQNVGGHILIESCGELLLVDTGSPMSFHESGKMTLCGRTFNVPKSLLNVNSEYVTKQVGAPVKGFVGMDFISAHPMSIDVKCGVLAFDCDTEGWSPVESRTLPGAVMFNMNVGGKPARIILDTGAPVSYISKKFTDGLEPVDTMTDFSPYHPGTFETNVYSIPCCLAGRDFDMRLGNLPTGLGLMVSVLGADGVVGMDMLKHFKLLVKGGRLYIK